MRHRSGSGGSSPTSPPTPTGTPSSLSRGIPRRVAAQGSDRTPGARATTFKPTLLAVEPNRELRWLGRLLLPGVFDGEHRFTLDRAGEVHTGFVQSETFKGVVVPLLGRALGSTGRGFEQMNQALKARAESAADRPQARAVHKLGPPG